MKNKLLITLLGLVSCSLFVPPRDLNYRMYREELEINNFFEEGYDFNRNGKIDEKRYYFKNTLIQVSYDGNEDGKPEVIKNTLDKSFYMIK